MIPFELTRPWALALLLIALPILFAFFVKSLSDFPAFQRKTSLAIRCLIVFLLVLALSGFAWLRKSDEQYFIFLIDQSTSISENGREELDKALATARDAVGDNKVAFLPFASTTGKILDSFGDDEEDVEQSEKPGNTSDDEATEVQIETVEELAALEEENQFRDGTNIAAAIEAAAGYLPPGYIPQIVLLSDGNETQGDAIAAASQSRIPISTVALPPRSEQEVQLSAVNVPAEVREGEPFMVEVIVQSNHEDEGLIEVFRGDHKVVSEKRKLKTGENRFQFQQSIERERLAAYTVRISKLENDTLLDNNIESGLVYAAGKPRVLIIESDPNLIRDLAYALEEEGIQSDIRPPQGMPESLADLQNYELVILSNVPATKLTQQQMEITRTYVQELGGGFIMLGGEQSFGLGGYYKSSLEEVLPVRSDFEKEKENPSLGMVLVIDKSGSMDGEPIEMAKSAARSAVELLGKRDYIGVIAFDGESFVISEMQSARNKGKISDEIARIDAGGGTNMYPAMELAFEMLSTTSAKLKHCIVLTDGVSAPGDFEGLTQTMVSSKMTVSTVGAGGGADVDLLEAIARVGKGRHYHTTDPSQVPQIFAKETVTASKSAIDEQPFLPQVIRATYALADIDMESAPFLLGYVMTRPKPTCEVVLATEKGDPLLAWWRYGLGMTAAFTSDAKNRWSAEWMTWEGFGKFWTQVIRHTMRKSDARGIIVDVKRNGKRTTLNVDAVNELGQFLNNANVELTLINPNLKRDTMALEQTAPGRYRTDFDTDISGAWHMEIALKKNDQVVYRQSRGLTVGYSDELRIRPTNESLLKSIADSSGGRFFEDMSQIAEKSSSLEPVNRPLPLWPWLVTAATFLLILDVALRRIDFSLHWPFRRLKSAGNQLAT